MKIAGGLLIAIGVLPLLSEIPVELLRPHDGRFDWWNFLSTVWPCALIVIVGVFLWRLKLDVKR